jgi:hypothetical protein
MAAFIGSIADGDLLRLGLRMSLAAKDEHSVLDARSDCFCIAILRDRKAAGKRPAVGLAGDVNDSALELTSMYDGSRPGAGASASGPTASAAIVCQKVLASWNYSELSTLVKRLPKHVAALMLVTASRPRPHGLLRAGDVFDGSYGTRSAIVSEMKRSSKSRSDR